MIPTLKARHVKSPEDKEDKPVPSVCLPKEYKLYQPPNGAYAACSPDGIYAAPLDNSAQSIALRAHEYAHLSIHRLQPQLEALRDKVSPNWYQVGLDNIVNGFATARGIDISALPMLKMPKGTPRKALAAHALQTLSYKTRKSFAGLSEKDVSILQCASKRLRRMGQYSHIQDNVNVDQAISILRNLEAYFGMEPSTENRSDLTRMIPGESAIADADTKPEWCKCSIETKPLTNSINRKWMTRKRIAGFVGAFRNPVRTLLPAFDGMGWSIKQKRQGGTILLDQSGSMNVTSGHVLKLLQDAPMATIAAYSSNGISGTVRILARNGKYASDCGTSMCGNGVDGPALDWMSKQAGPRVWICDGYVTGRVDQAHPLLSLECVNKCIEYGILRVNSLNAYFELARIKS